ncbi:hypothetical protein FRC00_006454 [Tulasnella sp. 408]|nr:hypothetical protein FRC00_006454 [Tulasnella sp. 408]
MLSNVPPPLSHHASSSSSIKSVSTTATFSLYPRADEGEEITVEGVPHSETLLEARRYKTEEFAGLVLTLLRTDLRVKTWDSPTLKIKDIKVEKVSGSLTNAIFFVSAPDVESPPRKVLIRIYGPSTSALINRPHELFILYKLSSVYRIGPRVFGTFGNGRVEEYFDSRALTEDELRVPEISRWIGRRMAELHSVDIEEVMPDGDVGKKSYVSVLKNFQSWLLLARSVLEALEKRVLPKDHPWYGAVQAFDLDRLEREWKAYWTWLEEYEKAHGESDRVFSHNDTQYGNLLRLTTRPANRPSHHQIIVVDFEYASPNPAAFDIANHFHEWTASYLSETTPWLLNPDRYPTLEERQNFYHAYISPLPTAPSTSNLLLSASQTSLTPNNYVSADNNPKVKDQLDHLEGLVQAWSPASHAQWALWGIVQARDDVEVTGDIGSEFNYIGYGLGRVEGFRREIAKLGIKV